MVNPLNIVPGQNLIIVRMGEIIYSSYEVPTEFNNKIWQKLNEIIYTQTSVNEPQIPVRFELKQNYPNSFNPETNITFTIPNRDFVTLKIFDILGRKVSVILACQLSAGTYS